MFGVNYIWMVYESKEDEKFKTEKLCEEMRT